MMETTPHPPTLLPLRLVLLSSMAACSLLAWQSVPSSEWAHLLVGLTPVGKDGTTLAAAMTLRCTLSLVLVLGTALLSQTLSLALSLAALRLGHGAPWLFRLVGRFFALTPIVALSWLAVGWIIGSEALPIESLVPHYPIPGQDTPSLSLGRTLWWWLLPIWLLAIPLTGELVTGNITTLVKIRRQDLADGLRARGVSASSIQYRHYLPTVWPDLLSLLQSRGIMTLGYLVFVEEALGIQGWGSFFASAIKGAEIQNVAGAIYAAGWMAAAWCLAISLLRRLTGHTHRLHAIPLSPMDQTAPRRFSSALGWVLLIVCTGFTKGEIPPQLSALVSSLVHDLGVLAASCALALLVAAGVGGGLIVLGSARLRLPQTNWVVTLGWSPLLIYLLGISAFLQEGAPLWIPLGIAAGLTGAQYLQARWREIASRPYIEAASVVGASRFRAWRVHAMPDMILVTLSWILKTAAALLLWLVLIGSLPHTGDPVSRRSLGSAIWRAEENVLSDPLPLLVAGLTVGILALFFDLLSRIVQPTSPPQ